MHLKEVQTIKASWRLLQLVDPLVIGDVFYSKLFFEHPQLKALFKTSKEEQSKKLIDMLNVIVGRLDRLNELNDDIAALALRHAAYGVLPQHYKSVTEALLFTLQKGMGNDWNAETEQAWQSCLTTLSATMIKAAYS